LSGKDLWGIRYIHSLNDKDYISLTDIARYKNQEEPKILLKLMGIEVQSTI
jgi:hypothetical protein